jgi:hypothetical protein
MQSRTLRQLGAFFARSTPASALQTQAAIAMRARPASESALSIPPEFSPRQYAALLLHVASEIEHALMVEYLYAAYTIGGPQVPEKERATAARWQEVIAGIAKEEMGHLMTVQNLLRALGEPLNLNREDYPWDSAFLPYPFRLEPLTLNSLARFIVAESPANWTGKEADEIRAQARKDLDNDARFHRVGELYAVIRKLIADANLIPDSAFRAETLPYQANWDEWGRGYRAGARGASKGAAIPATPDLLLLPVTSRTEALAAIDAIATQGEANPSDSEDAPSHFARFLSIYHEFPKKAQWASRPAPVNPFVASDAESRCGMQAPGDQTPITHPEARLWASLFNVRYRMLLMNLLHTFKYPGSLDERSKLSPRGLLIHRTFGEMYNLRAIAFILVQTPLNQTSRTLVAGPPFQMPFTLDLPMDEVDRWELHLQLIAGSSQIVKMLEPVAPESRQTYLQALSGGNQEGTTAIQTIITGLSQPRLVAGHR